MNELYVNRKLAQGYPDLDRLGLEKFTVELEARPDDTQRIEKLLIYLNRLVDLSNKKNILVLGCGPRPQTIKILLQKNYSVVGVEPVPLSVRSAREYLGSTNTILEGAAERIPLPDSSQNLVFFETVIEHVDSPTKSLDEIFRVLAPGGIVLITTNNRYRISLKGDNGEFNVSYFNWFPDTLKECFVFHHLHYDPSLANYAERPAVHWYSYADLCKLGRQAGFAQFYAFLDLVEIDDPSISKSKLRKFLLNKLKFNPWLRALALTQIGDSIIMLKRISS